MNKTINIATDFSGTPGARYRSDGAFSGQEFREILLEPLFDMPQIEKVTIILDGVEGYATSFLEEAFGGLARKYGKAKCKKVLTFISNEDEILIDEIFEYINNA